jgi:DNA-binding NarL/FixJ family response regulator
MGSVLVLTDDIFFLSKIRETAQRSGVPLRIASSAEAFREEAARSVPSLAIVDLNLRAGPLEAIRQLRAAYPKLAIIGYLSHVQTELAAEARSAGCSEVMARSKFTQTLATLLVRENTQQAATDVGESNRNQRAGK